MNTTIQRRFVIGGLTVLASAALALPAAPVSAATTAGTPTAGEQRTQSRDRDWDRRGVYDSRRECERAGRWGERRDWWEDYRCVRARRDHHGDWGDRWDRRRHWHRAYVLWVNDDDRDRHR